MKKRFSLKTYSGFSLLKILGAIAIIAMLCGVMLFQFMDCTKEATFQRLKDDIAVIDSAIIQYQSDNFLFPSTEQGLQALVSKPISSPAPKNYPRHGYLRKLYLDPWGNEYRYSYPGKYSEYDVYSLGADGELGGEGLGSDVGNWNINEVLGSLKEQD